MKSVDLADFERIIDSNEAAKRIFKVAEEVQEEKKLRLHCDEDDSIHAVYAYSVDGSQVAYGLGKGATSLVGAYGECIEHIYYRTIGESNACTITSSELFDTTVEDQDIVLKYAFSLEDHPKTVSCIQLKCIYGSEKILLPSFYFNYHLLEPHVAKRNSCLTFLSRYVTTSGTAFGLTEHDAILHALNEVLERHVTSVFLMSACGLSTQHDIRFQAVSISSIPSLYIELVDRIKSVSGGEMSLCVAHTPFGGWWAHCSTSHSVDRPYVLPQWGAGYSLSLDVAVYRAASECLQMLIAYDEENTKEDKLFKNFIEEYSRFAILGYINDLPPAQEFSFSQLRSCNQLDMNMSVLEQIDLISTGLVKLGKTPFSHIVKESPNFCVALVYVANLERFYNITKCAPVLPVNVVRSELQAIN